jgi:Tetratricopeptide repeat
MTLRALGQPRAARPLEERALAIIEAAYGPDHPDVATGLGNLALTLRALGQPEQARPLLERALVITQAATAAPPDEEKDVPAGEKRGTGTACP